MTLIGGKVQDCNFNAYTLECKLALKNYLTLNKAKVHNTMYVQKVAGSLSFKHNGPHFALTRKGSRKKEIKYRRFKNGNFAGLCSFFNYSNDFVLS